MHASALTAAHSRASNMVAIRIRRDFRATRTLQQGTKDASKDE